MNESQIFLLFSICYLQKFIIIIMRRVNLLKNAGFSTYSCSNNLYSSLLRFKVNGPFLQQQSRNHIYRLLLLEEESLYSISSGILMYFHYWHRAIWCSDWLSIRFCSDSSSRNLKDSYLASSLYPAELSACFLVPELLGYQKFCYTLSVGTSRAPTSLKTSHNKLVGTLEVFGLLLLILKLFTSLSVLYLGLIMAGASKESYSTSGSSFLIT